MISIGPILAVPGMRDALRRAAPVVAVSPLVRGAGAQGPDRRVPRLGRPPAHAPRASPPTTPALLDGLVADERADSVPTLVTDVEMGDAAGAPPRRRETLAFAAALAG